MSTTDSADEKEKAKVTRNYSAKTLKVLFAMSMNECAHPDCTQAVIQAKTTASDAAVVGQIAHIYAASNDGPRGKAGLTEKERNHTDNLILLCPTHHTIVDAQHETYPATKLQAWKERHHRKFQDTFGATMSDIGYEELELTARSLMAAATQQFEDSLRTIPPAEKIRKNGLGKTSAMLLTMGAANSSEVEAVLLKATQLDPSFADRLREGFVTRYRTFVTEGTSGDDLFMAMYEWAGGASRNKPREAAGLCILSHLFILCDVFER